MKTGFDGTFASAAAVFVTLALLPGFVDAGAPKAETVDIRYHDLSVSISPEKHELRGSDRITFLAGSEGEYIFYLGRTLGVKVSRLDGEGISLKPLPLAEKKALARAESTAGANDSLENVHAYRLPKVKAGEHVLEIEYNGVVYDTLAVPKDSRSGIAEKTIGLIGTEGTYLSGETGWYPDGRDRFARFSIRVTTPAGIEAVTEGKRKTLQRGPERTVVEWEVEYPTNGVTLVAGAYLIRERDEGGVTLMAYFFPSEQDLIDSFLDASARYIGLYNKLIGPYPFSKFAVVENFFPTGLGMPSFTLLGREIVRHPFILETSLRHEVVHDWWGNCVYPDYDSGNWCEGLATYFADYRYQAELSDSAAEAYRRDINVDYAVMVSDSTDMPLSGFRSRGDGVTGVIGYGKSMMVFHMLKNRMGEDKFYRAMRDFYRDNRFRKASWEDIESVFEDALQEPLDGYFDQWVRRTGAPQLTLESVSLETLARGGPYKLTVAISNQGGFDLTAVPLSIVGKTVTRDLRVPLRDGRNEFDWRLDERPLRIEVDPRSDIFRRFAPAEIPVTISRVLADKSAIVALPSSADAEKNEAYRAIAERLAASGQATVRADTLLGEWDLAANGVFILGDASENVVYALLEPPEDIRVEGGYFSVGGVGYDKPGNAAFITFPNMLDSTRTVCAIVGNSAKALEKAGYKIVFYGGFGYVTFLDGTKQATGTFPLPPGPLVRRFNG